MAFRAASFARHAGSLATRLGSTPRVALPSIPSRAFSCSSIQFFPSPGGQYPIDDLVADVLSTNDQLAASPPKRRGKPKRVLREEVDYGTELPPPEEWAGLFPYAAETKARSTVVNPETCKHLAEAFVPAGSKDMVILEAFPGFGTLTRALMDLPKDRIKKIIVMEDHPSYHKFLKPLEQLDPRVTVIPQSGFLWDAYEQMSALGLLDDVQPVDWSQEQRQLKFISHIPAKVHGEQLVSQFFRSIPGQQWLFKYGRVPLNLVMSDSLWQRISAPPGGSVRCKLSVIAEATASFDHIVQPDTLLPYGDHLFPPRSSNRHFVAIGIKPLQEQVIERGLLDEWDYCLRRMFVQRATPLKSTLPRLAPGAAVLLKKIASETLPLKERINIKTPPRSLVAKEWKTLIQAFADWPFKPEDLSIDNFHVSATKHESKKVL